MWLLFRLIADIAIPKGADFAKEIMKISNYLGALAYVYIAFAIGDGNHSYASSDSNCIQINSLPLVEAKNLSGLDSDGIIGMLSFSSEELSQSIPSYKDKRPIAVSIY